MEEFNPEEFVDYITKFSMKDRIDALAIILANIPMSIEDLSDILDILKENQNKLKT